jgi:hypothetical protein
LSRVAQCRTNAHKSRSSDGRTCHHRLRRK